MPSTITLSKKLKPAYPQFSFKLADIFSWSPDEKTIYFKDSDELMVLLHELSHGLLEHTDYARDVELIAMERQAWDKAIELATTYDVIVDDEAIETTLDSYRTWLHQRSTCPKCEANGLEIKKHAYRCVACGYEWRVNEARICALRRYKMVNTK